jgi:hypothetical protein
MLNDRENILSALRNRSNVRAAYGCGSVATAVSIASFMISMMSGENEALEKSFIWFAEKMIWVRTTYFCLQPFDGLFVPPFLYAYR